MQDLLTGVTIQLMYGNLDLITQQHSGCGHGLSEQIVGDHPMVGVDISLQHMIYQ